MRIFKFKFKFKQFFEGEINKNVDFFSHIMNGRKGDTGFDDELV